MSDRRTGGSVAVDETGEPRVVVVPARLNGFAVVSFVASILWLWGVGSLVALPFVSLPSSS